MIKYIRGSLFDSKMQTLTNTVNCVGVMGGGIALAFKDKYPKMFLEYKEICNNQLLDIGKLHLYRKESQWILNFPTKKDWKNPSKIEYIKEGLKNLVETYKEKGINGLAMPQLGCGLGGLNWNEVKPIMEYYLSQLDIPVEIYIRD